MSNNSVCTVAAAMIMACGLANATVAQVDIRGGHQSFLNAANDFDPGGRVRSGARIFLTAPAEVTYTFIGHEAGFNNIFVVNGRRVFENDNVRSREAGNYGTYTVAAPRGLLDFSFLIDDNIRRVVNNAWDGRGAHKGGWFDFHWSHHGWRNHSHQVSFGAMALSDSRVRLFLDDHGSRDRDYDDMVIDISTAPMTPVPEPAQWMAMLAGIAAVLTVAGIRRRRGLVRSEAGAA